MSHRGEYLTLEQIAEMDPVINRVRTAYIIGHNYHGHYLHAGGSSVNSYVRENKVREVYVRE